MSPLTTLSGFCRQIETALLPLILENNTARVEGAMPDEKVIGDNVLETLQPAHATARHAACLDSNPEVCHDAIEQQEADAMAARLVYTDAEVMVELVAQADFKPSMLNLTGSPFVPHKWSTLCLTCSPGLWA